MTRQKKILQLSMKMTQAKDDSRNSSKNRQRALLQAHQKGCAHLRSYFLMGGGEKKSALAMRTRGRGRAQLDSVFLTGHCSLPQSTSSSAPSLPLAGTFSSLL